MAKHKRQRPGSTRPLVQNRVHLSKSSSTWRRQDSLDSKPYGASSKENYITDKFSVARNRTPLYMELRRGGALLLPLPYSISRELTTSKIGYELVMASEYRIKWVDGQEVVTGPFPYKQYEARGPGVGNRGPNYNYDEQALLSAAFRGEVEARAVNKVLTGLKDQKVSFAQVIAEARQTANTIASVAKKFAKVIVLLRSGKLRLAAREVGIDVSDRAVTRFNKRHTTIRTTKDVGDLMSSGVLTVQYGLRPLVSDVIGAAEQLAHVRHSPVWGTYSRREVGGRKATLFDPKARDLNVTTFDELLKIRYGYIFSANDPLHLAAQMGFTNPAALAWELLPWSFVFDWLLPIGNYLNLLDATSGLSFRSGYKSTKVNQKVSTSCSGNSGASYYYGGESYENNSFTREILTSFPSAQPPRFKNPLSYEHALNALALLQQVVSKARKVDAKF